MRMAIHIKFQLLYSVNFGFLKIYNTTQVYMQYYGIYSLLYCRQVLKRVLGVAERRN